MKGWRRVNGPPTDHLSHQATMNIITRAEARDQGLTRYFTGKPCKKGHVAERRIASANCIECDREKDKSPRRRAQSAANHRRRRKESPEIYRAREVRKYRKHQDEILARNKRWKLANQDARIKQVVKYARERRAVDVEFRLKYGLRTRIQRAVKMQGTKKSASLLELCGCTVPELKAHLESQFQPGMSWENYGYYGWHIDHILPCAAFDLTSPIGQRLCFHYTNLQPLWMKDNFRKGARVLGAA